jgi:hypothetical protein
MKHYLHLLIFFLLFTVIQLKAQSPEQANATYELSISPNPVEDRATFRVTSGNYNLSEIKIYDLIGKEVYSIDLKNGSGVYPVDLSNLRPGVYFCTIFSEKGIIETRKLVRSKQ